MKLETHYIIGFSHTAETDSVNLLGWTMTTQLLDADISFGRHINTGDVDTRYYLLRINGVEIAVEKTTVGLNDL